MKRLFQSGASGRQRGVRAIALALTVVALGVPLVATWKVVLLAAALLAVLFSTPRATPRRVAVAIACVALAVGARALLPRADIAEAHNAFLVLGPGEALERGLPAAVFADWKAQFDAVYPPADRGAVPGTWPAAGGVPRTWFTRSSDALWRPARYTRQVDEIDFAALGQFRGGFANETQYNFWAGALRREEMPFFVMYELTPASVGSGLTWSGQVFWQRSDGTYEEVVHPEPATRTITAADAGRRVYALFIPKRDGDRPFRLERSPRLRASAWLGSMLSGAAVLATIALLLRLRTAAWFRTAAIISAGYLVMHAFVTVSAGKYLGRLYPPQGGGDDGLVHDGFGRTMAMLLRDGDVAAALEGLEPVYWFTPGTRYVRMVEKLIFGDTNHFFALLVASLAVVVFYLARHYLGARLAWPVTVVYLVMPVGSLAFLPHLANAKLGYGEAIAEAAFILGTLLLLRNRLDPAATAHRGALAVAGLALAASMFIRPNFALAVVWLAVVTAVTGARQRDWKTVAAFGAGLAAALWLPFHNWYFGGAFHLISGSSGVALPVAPADYLTAAGQLLTDRAADSREAAVVATQLRGWLFDPGFVVRPQLLPLAQAAVAIRLAALAATTLLALRWVIRRDIRVDVGILAVAALLAHAPMLVVHLTSYRYAMLGWDLSLVVLLTWLAGRHRAPSMPAVTVASSPL